MISPSNLERRMLCPGSERKELGFSDTAGPNALDGIRKHKIMESWVDWLRDGATAIAGAHLEGGGDADVKWAKEIMLPIISGALNQSRPVLPEENLSFYLQQELNMNREGDTNRCRADLVILGNEYDDYDFVVYDYKFGADVSDPGTDLQMISYAIGVRAKFGCSEVTVVKINGQKRKVMEATLSEQELDAYKIQIKKAVDDAYEDDAVRIAGEKQCKYCRARSSCPEQREYSIKKTENEHIVVTKKEVRSVSDFLELKPSERGEFLSALDESLAQFKQLRENIETFAIGSFEKDPRLVITGYDVRNGRGSREWRNEAEAVMLLSSLARDKGKSADCIYEPQKILSPAGAEKVFDGAQEKFKIASQVVPISGKLKLLKEKTHGL